MTAYLHGDYGVVFPDGTQMESASKLGMRNKIINGKMEIAQRGTSFAALSNSAYVLDRFIYNKAGSTTVVTVSQQSDVPSNNEFQSSLRVAITTADTSIATGDFVGVQQFIEGYNVRDLIGRTFTLSFWVRSSKTGTHCVGMSNSGGDRSYVAEYTISAANTWEQKSITVSGGLITAGTWNWTNGRGLDLIFVLAAGSTFQTTAGAWQTGNFYATSNQVNCLDTIGNIFAITGVQLEVGSVATPFEQRPYGMELALCQRYCQTLPYMYGNQVTTTNSTFGAVLPVSMRAGISNGLTVSSVSLIGVGPATSLSSFTMTTAAATFFRGAINHAAAGALGTPVEVNTSGVITAEL